MSFRKVAVLGAGAMGAQIALHWVTPAFPRSSSTCRATPRGRASSAPGGSSPTRSSPPSSSTLVTTGSFDDDLPLLADADWVIEAVVERLDIKRELIERVAGACRPDAVLTTNTSGIPVGTIAEGWPAERRARWLGTHFFNPPRYLPLLEVIPTGDTDPAHVAAVSGFADRVLGKGVVVARDTPNFIGNHLALHGVVAMLRAVESGRYTIDEVDAITGRAIGRPASATFRTMDIAGLDVLGHVLRNLEDRLPSDEDRAWFRTPELLTRLLAAGALGEKAGRGFYERRKDASGASSIFTFDPARWRVSAAAQARLSVDRGRPRHRRRRHPGPHAVPRQGSRWRVPARDAGPDPGLRGAGRARHRPFDRRRQSGDALGLRLGAGAVRARRRDRHPRGARRRGRGAPQRPPLLADALAAGRNRLREGGAAAGRPRVRGRCARPRRRVGSSRPTRGPASSTWVTACCASSSIPR